MDATSRVRGFSPRCVGNERVHRGTHRFIEEACRRPTPSRSLLKTRPSQRRLLRFEQLEDRTLLSVSAQEQLFVYLLNRARHDPVAYQTQNHLSVSLAGVAAQPPLAVNNDLFASAAFHANEMATYNYFAHQSSVTGIWPNQMVRNQGYALPASWVSNANYVESIAAAYPDAASALAALLVDYGVPSLGHRTQLLATDSFFAMDREIGVGFVSNASSTYGNYWAIHTAYVNTTNVFLTGVVYNDANSDGLYSLGEGLAGVSISIGSASTVTNAAGGWSDPGPAREDVHGHCPGQIFRGNCQHPAYHGQEQCGAGFHLWPKPGNCQFRQSGAASTSTAGADGSGQSIPDTVRESVDGQPQCLGSGQLSSDVLGPGNDLGVLAQATTGPSLIPGITISIRWATVRNGSWVPAKPGTPSHRLANCSAPRAGASLLTSTPVITSIPAFCSTPSLPCLLP